MKNKELIIFGTGKIAEVIYYYATEECSFTVAAFCVDAAHKKAESFLNKPVFDFENIENILSPDRYAMFIGIGYHELNAVRKSRYEAALSKGYELVSIISPDAKLPKNTHVGKNCFIMPPAVIHPFVSIGDDVFVWSGAMVGHHTVIHDHCWITSNCSIGGNAVVGDQTFIAMNAVIGHSVRVGKNCFLGANTLVTKNMEDGQVVISESSKPIKLNSAQFLRVSKFNAQ